MAPRKAAVEAEPKDSGIDRFTRVFDILELLGAHHEGLTVTAISKRLDLPTSSTHNLLQRMVKADVVVLTEGLRYVMGARALRLGIRIVDGLEVRLVAQRLLQDLARETGRDIYLAVPLGRRVSYVDRVQGNQPVSVDIRLGQSLHLHATSVGKLLAAHNDAIREELFASERPRLTDRTLTTKAELERELQWIVDKDYAVSREEAIPGIIGLAVPIRDAYDEVVAAIHISVLQRQVSKEEERQLIAAAKECASSIARQLGRHDPAPVARRRAVKAS